MAIFFLFVGLEIKREVMTGELSTPARAALPAVAAVGGMVAPALVYAGFNWGDPATIRGWAIPAATDIAFSLGVVALLGNRVPGSLKIFLLALAIIDDLGAILIIAIFYSENISVVALTAAGVGLLAMAALNLAGVTRIAPYVLVGIFLWTCILKSGIHATLAGVAMALAIPLRATDGDGGSPLEHLEHDLRPWVAFVILPVFALANAGVSFAGMSLGSLVEPVPLGIALGLFVGKQVGVVGASWAATRVKFGTLPDGMTWLHLYGTALLTGIGFTMSLFIGELAFDDVGYNAGLRIGVLGGSAISALAGYLVLHAARGRAAPSPLA
jgi:NhaA family Na+:H+ antiporter